VGRTKSGEIYHHLWDGDAITALLREHDLAKKEETEDMPETSAGTAGYG